MEKTGRKIRKGQSAIEYLILATTITIVVLVGFDERRGFLVLAHNQASQFFNESLRGILGKDADTVYRPIANDYP